MARSCHCLTNFVLIVVLVMFSAPNIRRNPLTQEHSAHPLRGSELVPGGMAKPFYVSCWGRVTIANDKFPRGGLKRWVWLHSCWCRRLNRLGHLWSQVEAWYGSILRVQVTIERCHRCLQSCVGHPMTHVWQP